MNKDIENISEDDLISYWKTFFNEKMTLEEVNKILETVSNINFEKIVNRNNENYNNSIKILDSFIWGEIENENYFNEIFNIIRENSYWGNFFEPILKKYMDKLINIVKSCNIIYDIKLILLQSISYILNQLNQVAYQTLIVELYYSKKSGLLKGNSKEERGKYFSDILLKNDNFKKEIYLNYPELTRILDLKAMYATDFIIKIISDTQNEFHNLEKYFNKKLGKIKDIYIGEGDTHNKGKSVVKIIFNTDIVLIYKPHNLDIDKKYYEFIKWINNLKILKNSKEDLLASKIYTINDSGWAEFIEHIECKNEKNVKDFYYKTGRLLCLLHTLNGNDMHNENIIAHKDTPVLIDLETLMHPDIHSDYLVESAIEVSLKEARESVTSTHLLPSKIINSNNEKILEIGGLGASKEQEAPFKGKFVENYGTDEVKIIKKYGKILPKNNNPIYKNKIIDSKLYKKEIIEGFKDIYVWILKNRDKYINKVKEIFRESEIRILYRATNVYAQLLFSSYHPDLLTNYVDRYVFLHRIAMDYKEKNSNLINLEIQSLMQGDIPYFTITANRKKINNVDMQLKESTLEKVINKIEEMSEARMYREVSSINTSFMAEDYSGHIKTSIEFQNDSKIEYDKDYLLKATKKIADYMLQYSIVGKKNGISSRTWMKSNDSGLGFRVFDNVGIDIYSGLSGITLFYNYLWKISNNLKYKQVMEESISSILEVLEVLLKNKDFKHLDNVKVGAFNGLGGIAYTLFYIDYSNNSSKYRNDILNILDLLDKDIKNKDIINDVGNLGVMISIYEKTHDKSIKNKVLEVCKNIFEKLNNTKFKLEHKKGILWSDKGYVGYSHGNSGIIAQLYRLYTIMNDTRILSLIDEALLYERSMYSDKDKNWYKSIDEHVCLCGWCHGAPGILLSKIQLKKLGYNDENIDNEIKLAIQKIITNGLNNDISLCHGDMGNMVILKEAAIILNDKQLYTQARGTIEKIVDFILHLMETDEFKENQHNEFMIGLSGIAYEILRIGRENKLPNILGLE